MRERKETGLCAAGALAVGRNELHRALEFGFRNCRVLRQDLLIRSVFDAVAGQLLPIARPIAAEPAIAVIDELGPHAGCGRFSGIDGLIFQMSLSRHQRAVRSVRFVSAFVGENVGRYPLACMTYSREQWTLRTLSRGQRRERPSAPNRQHRLMRFLGRHAWVVLPIAKSAQRLGSFILGGLTRTPKIRSV